MNWSIADMVLSVVLEEEPQLTADMAENERLLVFAGHLPDEYGAWNPKAKAEEPAPEPEGLEDLPFTRKQPGEPLTPNQIRQRMAIMEAFTKAPCVCVTLKGKLACAKKRENANHFWYGLSWALNDSQADRDLSAVTALDAMKNLRERIAAGETDEEPEEGGENPLAPTIGEHPLVSALREMIKRI